MEIDLSLHPRCQKQIIGHKAQQTLFIKNLTTQQLAHAWLLTGRRGIGKATVAYALARYLLKDGQQDQNFIDHMIDLATDPNLMVLERIHNEDGKWEREISIAQVRKLLTILQQSPARPGWRCVIVDAADELNRNSANALLKVLEEPPAKTIFLVLAHVKDAVLPTIRSRCQVIDFNVLKDSELINVMAPSQPQDALKAWLACGSLGRLARIHHGNGVRICEQLLMLMSSGLRGKTQGVTSFFAPFLKESQQIELVLEMFQWLCLQLVLNNYQPSTCPEPTIAQKINDLAQQRPAEHWVKSYEQIENLLYHGSSRYLDPVHFLTALLIVMENPELAKEMQNNIAF